MVKQISVDENGIIKCASVGGFIDNGINVEDIPDAVMQNPVKWKYIGGKFIENEDYTEPETEQGLTMEDIALAIAELAESINGGE